MAQQTKAPTFAEWYRQQYGERLPLYVQSDRKKQLVREYEAQTGVRYEQPPQDRKLR